MFLFRRIVPSIAVVTSLIGVVCVAPKPALSAVCTSSLAVRGPLSDAPVSVTFTGLELGEDVMAALWDITTSESGDKFDVLGRVIGEEHQWMGNCTYPGFGIGNGSGFDWQSRNVTLWMWQDGIVPDLVRSAVYRYLGAQSRSVQWANDTITLTDTQFVADAHSILQAFSAREFVWDLDGDGQFEHDTGSSPYASASWSTIGAKTVSVKVTASGIERTASVGITVFLKPPHGETGVTINSGERRTTSRNVSVSVVWPTWAESMLVSNDGSFQNATSLALVPTFDWELEDAGYGTYTSNVYVRFVGSRIDRAIPYSDSIVLDVPPPTTTTTTTTTPPVTTTTVPGDESVGVVSVRSIVRSMSLERLAKSVARSSIRTRIVVSRASRGVCKLSGAKVVAVSGGTCKVNVIATSINGVVTSRVVVFKVSRR